MKHRTLGQTILKSIRRCLTSPPTTWYWQWKMATSSSSRTPVPSARGDYLKSKGTYSRSELLVGGIQVMQDWERPIMHALAKEAASNAGHVLEVGFGMGISADYLIQAGCSQYTVIEPHPAVLEQLRTWAQMQAIPVKVVEGFWEDVIDNLPTFDGILFDTYPVSESETHQKVYLSFIPKASKHLRPGGIFTFYTGYPDSLPSEHTKLLKEHFSKVEFYHVTKLKLPLDCQYYRYPRMVVPICTK